MSLLDEVKKTLPDVTGKVFVITGTTSGTGLVAAQVVAEKGGEVVLLNRPSGRVDASLEKLRAAVPEGKFVPIACDLQDFASVRAAAKEIKMKYDKIYCLSNNAGIMATPDEATKDGYDKQMQTNHLSHFLLTKELFPLIAAGAKEFNDARIVQHSSGARKYTANNGLEDKYFGPNGGSLGGDKPGSLRGPQWDRYAQTKLANSVFNQALHEKIQASDELKNIRAIAAHPGGSKTSLADHLSFGCVGKLVFTLLDKFAFQDAEDGSLGLLKGMMDPEAMSGNLYGPKRFSGAAILNPPQPYETDATAKEMLWHTSEEATGVKFDL